ncbi:hypothetical protein [Streptomyces fuscichromogenes]|uniref:Uncharacterized protein n=1 Tax=Streptomyces fuscichromogenes TaxID=1324013 RepID=A0A917XQP5_9ACTN|nr:hypothetical protein [Streptomyces fuscichromogenes]GGN46158.1 hypothetical protein GCM10011578_098790 [Streptomyces fuscichromogenes]
MATGGGGAEADGRLLAASDSLTRAPTVPSHPTLAHSPTAAGLWRAALAATAVRRPAGAGGFADAGLDEDLWPALTRASAAHTPALPDADLVACLSDSEDALLLAAQMVTHSVGAGKDTAVRRSALALLDAAAVRPADEQPAGPGVEGDAGQLR